MNCSLMSRSPCVYPCPSKPAMLHVPSYPFWKRGTNGTTGMWNLPTTTAPPEDPTVAQMGCGIGRCDRTRASARPLTYTFPSLGICFTHEITACRTPSRFFSRTPPFPTLSFFSSLAYRERAAGLQLVGCLSLHFYL